MNLAQFHINGRSELVLYEVQLTMILLCIVKIIGDLFSTHTPGNDGETDLAPPAFPPPPPAIHTPRVPISGNP